MGTVRAQGDIERIELPATQKEWTEMIAAGEELINFVDQKIQSDKSSISEDISVGKIPIAALSCIDSIFGLTKGPQRFRSHEDADSGLSDKLMPEISSLYDWYKLHINDAERDLSQRARKFLQFFVSLSNVTKLKVVNKKEWVDSSIQVPSRDFKSATQKKAAIPPSRKGKKGILVYLDQEKAAKLKYFAEGYNSSLQNVVTDLIDRYLQEQEDPEKRKQYIHEAAKRAVEKMTRQLQAEP